MSKKQYVREKTQKQAESPVAYEDQVFDKWYGEGDMAASTIPKGGFAKLENLNSYPHEVKGREGSYLHTTTAYPTFATGFTASKTGTTITATVGAFLSSYIGKYFVWPDGDNDQITGWTNATTLSTRNTSTKASVAGCVIRDAIFGNHWHADTRKQLIHLGERMYHTTYANTTYTQVYPISYESLITTKSIMSNFDDDYVMDVNSGQLFKINVKNGSPYYYRMNSPVPEAVARPDDVTKTDDLKIGSRYLFSMTSLRGGKYTGNRVGDPDNADCPTLTIEQESGTNEKDANGVDYAEVYTEKMVGLGNETYGLIISGVGASGHAEGINKDINLWRTLSSAGFSIDFNGYGPQDIFCDFSSVDTLDDVALVIQFALRIYPPMASAYVTYFIDDAGLTHFIISTGKIDGTYFTLVGIDPIATPADIVVTDISGYDPVSGCGLLCTTAEGGVIADADTDPNYFYTAPSTLSSTTGIRCAPIPDSSTWIPQRHWTHFSFYRTLDVGPAGYDPISGIGNNVNVYMWDSDIPIMKAFNISNTGQAGGYLLVCSATGGTFNQADIGNVLTFQDGTVSTIQYLCDAALNRVYTETSDYAIGNTVAATASQAAVLGSSRCMTLSRTAAGVVTRTGGTAFTANDVRKPIFWADGDITYIIAYTNGNTVTDIAITATTGAKVSQGAAMDPSSRIFTDTTTDEILKARMIETFLLRHRLFTHLPTDIDRGTVVQGFVVVGKRGDHNVYYSQLSAEREYRGGYYYAPNQYDSQMKDVLHSIEADPDVLTVRCANSTYSTPTNSQLEYDTDMGFKIQMLPPLSIVDNNGTTHPWSIRSTQVTQKVLLCNDYSVRFYDRSGYGEDLSKWQVEKIIRKTAHISFSAYNPISGYLLWLSTREA